MGHEKVLRVEFFMKDKIDWRSRDGYWSSGTMVIGYSEEVPRDVVLSEEELSEACARCPVGKEEIPGLICGGMVYVNPRRNQILTDLRLSEYASLPEGARMYCGLDQDSIQSMKGAKTLAEAVAQYTGNFPLVPYN